ncbi:DUF2911 domain-containing protein [Flaviaesturariibacter amylovorans]|uniref:DUF2911 domain-containing protein n=1 Tax=Flaviaesturariibacter amylovorans TaxID=1084520 RepID=A0ABP8HAQ6_9BACT
MIRTLLLALGLFSFSAPATAQAKAQEEVCYNPNKVKDTTKKSLNAVAVGVIGRDSLKISYHSPGVRGRIIWGGLVPYDEVWVTGAHNATNLTVNRAFIIAGKEIPAGKYAVFTIPGKKEWIVIINRHWDQHLTNEYDSKDDVVRFKVKPRKSAHTERLRYFIEPVSDRIGTISVVWEKTKVTFPVQLK